MQHPTPHADGAGRGQTHRRFRAVPTAIVIVSIALGSAACSSSTPTVNTATAPTDIGQVYNSFFKLAGSSLQSVEGNIQSGSELKQGLSEAIASPDAKLSGGASVSKVTVLSDSQCSSKNLPAPCASVSYSILGTSGAPLLTGQSGYAIYENNRWLVSKSTACNLLVLFYSAEQKTGTPPGC